MTLFKAVFQCVVACAIIAPGVALAKPVPTKTPEEVADLYFGAWVKLDEAIEGELSKYLQEPEDRTRNEVALIADTLRSTSGSELAILVYPDIKDPARQSALAALFQATTDSRRRSDCRALSHVTEPNEYVDGDFISRVSFLCKIAEMPAELATLRPADIGKMPIKKILALAKMVEVAPVNRDVSGALNLYSGKSTHKLLRTGFPGFSDSVLDHLTPGSGS